jgi:hypothetical protein
MVRRAEESRAVGPYGQPWISADGHEVFQGVEFPQGAPVLVGEAVALRVPACWVPSAKGSTALAIGILRFVYLAEFEETAENGCYMGVRWIWNKKDLDQPSCDRIGLRNGAVAFSDDFNDVVPVSYCVGAARLDRKSAVFRIRECVCVHAFALIPIATGDSARTSVIRSWVTHFFVVDGDLLNLKDAEHLSWSGYDTEFRTPRGWRPKPLSFKSLSRGECARACLGVNLDSLQVESTLQDSTGSFSSIRRTR